MRRALPTAITGAAVLGTIRGNANVTPPPDGAPAPARKTRISLGQGKTKTTTRLERRAGLAATYAGLMGAQTPAHDIHEAMRAVQDDGTTVSAATLAQGLAATGLKAETRSVVDIAAAELAAIAMMTGGRAVLVLVCDADTVTLYEAGAAGNRTEVALGQFSPCFTGEVVHAETALGELDARHSPVGRKRHWFWSELTRYRSRFADVAMGSFVANLLAVAMALFSLQVYDRVIPHQSTATPWVLASGVFLAILLEAALKIARARLMDGAGKALELNIQRMLMGRVLGMRSDKRPASPSGLFATMREFASVREFFTAASVGALTDLPFVALFLMLVATIAGPVVWILVAGGALMVLPGFLLQKRMVELSRQTQGASAKTSRLLQEAIFEIDTIKAARGEERFVRLWTELTMLQALKSSEQRKLASRSHSGRRACSRPPMRAR